MSVVTPGIPLIKPRRGEIPKPRAKPRVGGSLKEISPEGAKLKGAEEFRPFRACHKNAPSSQGFALGYGIPPPWG